MSCVQGSMLGLTLWTLYINSLLERLEKSIVKVDFFAYADDLSIVKHLSIFFFRRTTFSLLLVGVW